jgi:hypothetical protein
MKDNGGEHRHCWHWGGVELYEGFALIILYSKPCQCVNHLIYISLTGGFRTCEAFILSG